MIRNPRRGRTRGSPDHFAPRVTVSSSSRPRSSPGGTTATPLRQPGRTRRAVRDLRSLPNSTSSVTRSPRRPQLARASKAQRRVEMHGKQRRTCSVHQHRSITVNLSQKYGIANFKTSVNPDAQRTIRCNRIISARQQRVSRDPTHPAILSN